MKTNNINNIRVVLVETSHPGNIGAAARAMKTMGYKKLYLVNPKIYPSAEATARAAGADDILADATVCPSLGAAVKDCPTVIASTARLRNITLPVYSPREYAPILSEIIHFNPIALVFGRENSGLSNTELELCNVILQIPTAPAFTSLNVAAAVQILCYEFAQSQIRSSTKAANRKATTAEMQYLYAHLEQAMIDVDFLDPKRPRKLMRRLKCLFNRAQLDANELNIMRGFLNAVQNACSREKSS